MPKLQQFGILWDFENCELIEIKFGDVQFNSENICVTVQRKKTKKQIISDQFYISDVKMIVIMWGYYDVFMEKNFESYLLE